MVTAVVLIDVKRGMVNQAAQALVQLDGVAEVYSVGGQYDLVAILRARDNEALADLVTSTMPQVEALEKTTTLFALRAHSQYDLERMFGVGMTDGE